MVNIIPRLHGGETISAVTVDTYQPHTEFYLKKVITDHYEFFYSCCPEPYPLITYELVLQRQSLTVRLARARAPPSFLPSIYSPPSFRARARSTSPALSCRSSSRRSRASSPS